MTTTSGYAGQLTAQQFAAARKQALLNGVADMRYYQEASLEQSMILHQIELTVKSVKEEDLEE